MQLAWIGVVVSNGNDLGIDICITHAAAISA
jgi:hypothetical protein